MTDMKVELTEKESLEGRLLFAVPKSKSSCFQPRQAVWDPLLTAFVLSRRGPPECRDAEPA